MIHFQRKRLEEIVENAQKSKIMVFGDLMVDEYMWGQVSRISPEAPVPIINISKAQTRFGGAANVAFNLMGLKHKPVLVGVVGEDRMGHEFLEMMRSNDLATEGIIVTSERSTAVKTRIIGNNQHIARVDQESTDPVSSALQEKLFEVILKNIEDIEAIIIEDYNKGVVLPQLTQHIIELAERHGKYVTVDPKFENFFSFKNVTVFKPNTKEVEEALAMRIYDDSDVLNAGKKLLSELKCRSILITRGADGMVLFQPNEDPVFVEAKARKVADVSGAGDTVIATLTYALAGGSSIREAVTLSNFAAGLVCEEVGVVPVNLEKLMTQVLNEQKDKKTFIYPKQKD
ncbi:MAG: D-glycero-beta-D-manno-heptose-7-phosphate kinase [Calditrichaeota bacterium]|nr:D-glycero-beta-D-manno-heptose-7-phosphate kinase [Calditrichota bacterium]